MARVHVDPQHAPESGLSQHEMLCITQLTRNPRRCLQTSVRRLGGPGVCANDPMNGIR
jgi:hypothetical protein